MAYHDPTRNEIIVRVVYDGLATAGKTTNLRALHACFADRASREVYVPAEKAGRTLYFDWLELMTGHVDDWPLRCQLLTVPGQFAYAERRYRILSDVDAIVAVCDSSPAGVRAARIAWTFLREVLASTQRADVPIVVQANKQDLPGALPLDALRAELDIDDRIPIVAARAASGDGVRPTFIAALDRARSRVRVRLREHGAAGLPPCTESAEELYALMLADTEAPPAEAARAVEAALRELSRSEDADETK